MSNPVLVEVTRGPLVENRHRGAIAIADVDGRLAFSIGDTQSPTFPRSSVKLIQALHLIETGAADAFGFGDEELALVCSSHSGEERHVTLAASMLARCGRRSADLECGAHAPLHAESTRALVLRGEKPNALHNTCSGKHAGFVCLACHLGVEPKGYARVDHPVQQNVKSALEDVTGLALGTDVCGTDGCTIPTFAIPIARLARGFARLVTGKGLSTERTAAAERLIRACMAQPLLVGGSRRFCTEAMLAFPGRLFVKSGADGVFVGAMPHLGLGIALKCDDGTNRAAETIMATVISAFFPEADAGIFADRLSPAVETRTGKRVGEMKPVAELSGLLRRTAAPY